MFTKSQIIVYSVSLAYFFNEEQGNPKIQVTQPVEHGFLIKYAFTLEEIKNYFSQLSRLPWKIQEIEVAGKRYMPKRETLAFAHPHSSHLLENRSSDGMIYPNPFSNLRKKVRTIIDENILEIEKKPEMNYCWGNRYRNGTDKVGKHKDDEKGHSKIDPIVSVSFGESRFFDIFDNNKHKIERISLGYGDIFLMMPGFQQEYYHAVPQQKKIDSSRINLTFRTITTNTCYL